MSAWASRFVGTPWRAYGRDRAGVDCWGLVVLVYEEVFGVALPRYDGRSWPCGREASAGEAAAARAEIGAFMAHEAVAWQAIEPGEERAGDVLLLRLGGAPCHVGIVTEPGSMLHAQERSDAVIEPYRSVVWERRIAGIYRHEGLANV